VPTGDNTTSITWDSYIISHCYCVTGGSVTGGNPVSKCSKPVSGDHMYLDQSSTWKTSSGNPSVRSTSILSRYPKESLNVSEGSMGISNGLPPSRGLIIGIVCAISDPDIVDGRRLYIGSKVCSTNNGSRVRFSGAERRNGCDGALLVCAADEVLDMAFVVVDCVRLLDSVPDPSDPDQSAVKAESRREDESG